MFGRQFSLPPVLHFRNTAKEPFGSSRQLTRNQERRFAIVFECWTSHRPWNPVAPNGGHSASLALVPYCVLACAFRDFDPYGGFKGINFGPWDRFSWQSRFFIFTAHLLKNRENGLCSFQ
jgi:hypothetical protein